MFQRRLRFVLGVLTLFAQSVPPADPIEDRAVPQAVQAPIPRYTDLAVRSLYLTMRDGVRIAVDLLLPKDLPAGASIPALLNLTRYWRAREGEGPRDYQRFFVSHGYAMVLVDVSGTGASFGVWRGPWSPDEIKDGGEIVNWIVAQPWSNGKVGAIGTSYEGATAQLLAVPNHPAVKGGDSEISGIRRLRRPSQDIRVRRQLKEFFIACSR